MPIRNRDPFADHVADIDPTKNPYVLKLIEAQTNGSLPVAFGPTLKDFPGRWRSLAGRYMDQAPTKLVVEIGCHNGHTLCAMAEAHPDVLFVGVDITFKRIITTAEKSKHLGLNNVFLVLANAGGLDEMFEDKEVDGFVTFFPDPWKKKKHTHYRLYQESFCKSAKDKLSDGGFLWLKTDHEPYFDEAKSYVESFGFQASEVVPILGTSDFASAFQRRFESQGMRHFGQRWVKPVFH